LKVVYFDQELEKAENSNLASGLKMTKIHEVNMITSHFEEDNYKPEVELDKDDYSTDRGDSQYGDPDIEYQVSREQTKPQVWLQVLWVQKYHGISFDKQQIMV
jgi:hypothetical protein